MAQLRAHLPISKRIQCKVKNQIILFYSHQIVYFVLGKKDDEANDEEENDEKEDDNKATLLETVAEYEAKRASINPATTIQGDTSTGEENEITKFQVRIFYSTIYPNLLFVVFFSSYFRWPVNYLCIVANNNNLSNVAMEY